MTWYRAIGSTDVKEFKAFNKTSYYKTKSGEDLVNNTEGFTVNASGTLCMIANIIKQSGTAYSYKYSFSHNGTVFDSGTISGDSGCRYKEYSFKVTAGDTIKLDTGTDVNLTVSGNYYII